MTKYVFIKTKAEKHETEAFLIEAKRFSFRVQLITSLSCCCALLKDKLSKLGGFSVKCFDLILSKHKIQL